MQTPEPDDYEVVAGMLAAEPSHVEASRVIQLMRAHRLEEARRLIEARAERTRRALSRQLATG